MKIIFVSYQALDNNSGMHIFHLANTLTALGAECAAYTPGSPDAANMHGEPLFRVYGAELPPHRLARILSIKHDDSLVHLWTPREISRCMAEPLAAALGAPLVVHMEDNEESIFNSNLALYPDVDPDDQTAWLPHGRLCGLSHPVRYKELLARAAGYTCVIDSLLDFKPAHVPGHVIRPSCEEEVFDMPPHSLPEEKVRLGIAPESPVIFYPGGMHLSNYEEIYSLYSAVCMLRQAGLPIRIIKHGRYAVDLSALSGMQGLGDCLADITDTAKPSDIPRIMLAADYLVQPGIDNAFNHYRFPCKLPLFLASGRPVILPKSNLGRLLTHGKNCLLLEGASDPADEICALLLLLIKNPRLATAIGTAGREFARGYFSWRKTAESLYVFYGEILERHKRGMTDTAGVRCNI
ncbi:MAG: glycosyltransferase family 4 protein [Desulfovibrio sp.]|jgi:glycosyltransferase involved in cell wall biosynthesis|nr:glycosyltransferase family 4 protein [Desulfovibrio sp.]